MAEPYISEIRCFAFGETPPGWVPCDGRLLPTAQHQPLYALIGTTYGGDAKAGTFAVPDLRDRVPVGFADDLPPGRAGGDVDHALTVDELPSHVHPIVVSDSAPQSGSGHQPGPDRLLSNSNVQDLYCPPEGEETGEVPLVAMHEQSISPAGAGRPHANEQPYLTVSFQMATHGFFPSHP